MDNFFYHTEKDNVAKMKQEIRKLGQKKVFDTLNMLQEGEIKKKLKRIWFLAIRELENECF